jgi:uncharacterized protein (DUF58 family)
MAIMEKEGPRLTPLLTNEALARLERMRLRPLRRLTSRSRGEHLSGRTGTSTEFCDYRDYAPGDDVRFVDWNIFARLNRPYLKLYHQEEEMHDVILVDASASMGFEGKLDLAKKLAAAFGVMGLYGTERVSLHVLNGAEPAEALAPTRGRSGMMRLFEAIEPIAAGGEVPLEAAIEGILRGHSGRGIAVILSDFFTFGDLERPLNRLFSAGLEICGVQIMGPTEIDPETQGDLRFVDSESAGTLDISSAGDLLSIYQEHRREYEARLGMLCRRRCGRFLGVSAASPAEWVLFDLLRRKGWVR